MHVNFKQRATEEFGYDYKVDYMVLSWAWNNRSQRFPTAETQIAKKDVEEFPLTSLDMPITVLQLSESNNNKLFITTSSRNWRWLTASHTPFFPPQNVYIDITLAAVCSSSQVEIQVILAATTAELTRSLGRRERTVRSCIWVSGPVGEFTVHFVIPVVSCSAYHC